MKHDQLKINIINNDSLEQKYIHSYFKKSNLLIFNLSKLTSLYSQGLRLFGLLFDVEALSAKKYILLEMMIPYVKTCIMLFRKEITYIYSFY